MPSYFNIYVTDLHVFGKIGVHEQERIVGNEFIINLRITINAENFEVESLSTTVSYVDLYDIIKEEMGRKSVLLESVAKRISDRIAELWEGIKDIKIRIDKLKPPITGIEGSCGAEYCYHR